MAPEQIAHIMEALGRIEQKIDGHIESHGSNATNARWAIGFSVAALIGVLRVVLQ